MIHHPLHGKQQLLISFSEQNVIYGFLVGKKRLNTCVGAVSQTKQSNLHGWVMYPLQEMEDGSQRRLKAGGSHKSKHRKTWCGSLMGLLFRGSLAMMCGKFASKGPGRIRRLNLCMGKLLAAEKGCIVLIVFFH